MHHTPVARIRLLDAFASGVRRFAPAVFAAILSLLTVQAIGQVRHHYDKSGRLVGVVAPDGQTAHYRYDAAGKIVSINNPGSTTASITEFTPNGGPVGATTGGKSNRPAKPAN